MIGRLGFNPRLRFAALAVGVLLSVATLSLVGYHATAEWQHSAALLAQRSADETAELLVTAITRDMTAVQSSVLPSLVFDESDDPTLDLNSIESAFARYPYPETFFAARVGDHATTIDALTFYARADRMSPWLPAAAERTPYPVVVAAEPTVSRQLLTRIARDAAQGRVFSAFDVTLDGEPYQVVGRLLYADAAHSRLGAIAGFIVNLDWARQQYFQEVTSQIGRIRGADNGHSLELIDDGGMIVARAGNDSGRVPSSVRPFQMMFLDPSLVALDPPSDLRRRTWQARASVSGDRTLAAARGGASQALGLAAISALVLVLGLTLTVRAGQRNARLVEMRSEFVSAVTHELKTPIATIRAISETLASGRSRTPGMSREYAQLAVHESKRLTRLIDNLLAYSRISDVTHGYAFETIGIDSLVQECLKEFSSQLSTSGFQVTMDVPADLPPVRADHPSMVLAIGNLIDNAIRYSPDERRLTIRGRRSGLSVVLEVSDRGSGIPADEIPHITKKFFRGRHKPSGGSGLGLSIAQRIVSDHAGTLTVASEVGAGTTVNLTLPARTETPGSDEVYGDEADLDR